ncbi:MAG: hypothetical protein IAF38_13835 [Bacteroidia bacterium]|nr:hypothetical protein [Bacteroidia bacterium]
MKFLFFILKSSLLFLSFTFLISSCDVVKRKYMRGFYVSKHNKATKSESRELQNKLSFTSAISGQTILEAETPSVCMIVLSEKVYSTKKIKLHLPGKVNRKRNNTQKNETRNKVNDFTHPFEKFTSEKILKKNSQHRDFGSDLALGILLLLAGFLLLPPVAFTWLIYLEEEKGKAWKIALVWLAWLPFVFCIFFFLAKLWLCILLYILFNILFSVITEVIGQF